MRALMPALALLIAAVPAVAAAQPSFAVPDAAVLERMCSPRGAMQFAFGQQGVPGSSPIESRLGQGASLPAPLAPFTRAQPRASEWSDQFMEMTYKVALPRDLGEAYVPRLADALAAAGWHAIDMADDQLPMYLMAYGGDHTFVRPVGDGEASTRVLASVQYGLGELMLICGRDDLLKRHFGEAFGDLPAGTSRPVAPEVPLPPVASAADCRDPAKLAAMQASLEDRRTDSYLGLMLARSAWRDRLTTWMSWKLKSSGKVKEDRLLDLTINAAGAGSPGGNPLAVLETLPALFEVIGRIGKAQKAGNQPAVCLAIVDFRAFMTKADAITLRQTQAVQTVLVSEAKRLGVSLD